MVIDVLDGTDPELLEATVSDIRKSGEYLNPDLADPDLGTPALQPVVIRGGSLYGVRMMVDEVIRRVGRSRRIRLLRIHGHGNQTAQLVGGWEVFGIGPALTLPNLGLLRPTLKRLAPWFSPLGRAQLMGCNVGQAPFGPMLLQGLADIWGVPVSAGKDLQYSGNGNGVSYEGPVETAYPRRGGSQWMEIPF